MEDKKIVFIASECQPFFASGGLGDVIGSLPQKIASASEATVSVILPLYSKINPAWRNKLLYVGQMTVQLAWRKQYCGIFKYEAKDVTIIFWTTNIISNVRTSTATLTTANALRSLPKPVSMPSCI